jgi:hypothetical protein
MKMLAVTGQRIICFWCEIHSWFETGGRRDDENGIVANVVKGADGVTGASPGSEVAHSADGNWEINLRGEEPAADAAGAEVKPDPPVGAAELGVDDGMGKPEKLDSDTDIVADTQKCRVTKQTGADGMEGLLL